MGRPLLWLSWVLLLLGGGVVVRGAVHESLEDNEAIQRFREYLRIRTDQPAPDYAAAVAFLRRQAREIGLEAATVELVARKPIVVMTWAGSEPALPSVLLNSHMDVVQAEGEWAHDPFAAAMDGDGNIFARGTQDMKGMGMHYLEAIRVLKRKGFRPVRSVHVVFVPDEEIGGDDGWGAFINSAQFAALNAGIAMDEGPIPLDENSRTYTANYAEKSPWWLVIRAEGAPGHGSVMYSGSALENLFKSIESITCFRDAQANLAKAGIPYADVVSVNGAFLEAGTRAEAGFAMNVQPAAAEAGFDIRVPPNAEVASALKRRIAEEWAPSSRNLSYWFKQMFETEDGQPPVTTIGDSNPWWVRLQLVVTAIGSQLVGDVCTASTDMRYLRSKGVPAFGFTTIQSAPMLIHATNEFVNGWAWLRGIPVYADVIETYANFSGMAGFTDVELLQSH